MLSTHGLVCIAIAMGGDEWTLREIGDRVGIAERSTHRIVTDLEREGYVRIGKEGARNTYTLITEAPLRHAMLRHMTLGDLMRGLKVKPRRAR